MATTTTAAASKEPVKSGGGGGSQTSMRDDSASQTSLPRIDTRHNKIYRAPPTPPLEKLRDLEKTFVLDSVAVSNISSDYSRANPKLGSVIPPYNSLNDPAIAKYFDNYGVKEVLKINEQVNKHFSFFFFFFLLSFLLVQFKQYSFCYYYYSTSNKHLLIKWWMIKYKYLKN